MSVAPDSQGAEAAPLTPATGDQTDNQAADPALAGAEGEDDVEAEALAMGWKPLDRFKGAKADFIDAKTYIERGRTILPFLRNELKRRDREIEGLKKGLETSIKHISRADERAYAKAKADLEAELAQYAEAGNKEAVKAVTDDLIALEKDRAGAPQVSDESPEFTAWREENQWFGRDRVMTAACAEIGQEVYEAGYTGAAQIKEVDRRMREAFPQKFAKPENPNRRQPGAVEGGGMPRARAGKSYADLPPDAKQFCDELVRDKVMTREQYVKTYDWS